MRPRKSLAERFWPKVKKGSDAECWIWQAKINKQLGYGQIATDIPGRRRYSNALYAHRVSWVLTNGPIPRGMSVLHKCDQRACVNPAHLFLGTQRDNVEDMHRKGRAFKRLRLLSDAQIWMVGFLYDAGYGTTSSLAKLYGVHPSNIWRIISRGAVAA